MRLLDYICITALWLIGAGFALIAGWLLDIALDCLGTGAAMACIFCVTFFIGLACLPCMFAMELWNDLKDEDGNTHRRHRRH